MLSDVKRSRIQSAEIRSIGPAAVLYCSTLFFSSYYVEVITLFVFLLFAAFNSSKRSGSRIRFPPNELIFLLISYILLSILYFFSTKEFSIFGSNPILGIILIVVAILCSGVLTKRILFYFLVFCAFESFVALYQYMSGTHYFFEAQLVGRTALNSSDIYGLYSNKSLGLGYSSTQLSAKIIFALCAYVAKGGRPSFLLLAILMVGSLATFSRAGVLSLLIISSVLMFNRGLIHKFFLLFLFLLISFFSYQYLEVIFLKNKSISEVLSGDVDLSVLMTGRIYIWEQAWAYWKENLIVGGLGVAQTFKKIGGEANAHNSILYILTKGGLLLFFPYFFILAKVALRIGLLLFLGFLTFLMFGASIGSYLSYYEVILFSMLYSTSSLQARPLLASRPKHATPAV